MKKRILVGVMAMMMLASSVVPTAAAASQGAMATSVTAHANESSANYDNTKASKEESYRIDFQNDILFNSTTMRSNLNIVSENLDEIVFTVDAGDDTFTVGYYLGDETYSLEKIMQQIETTVDEINSDIKNEARVSSNNHISLSDLQLKYIVVETAQPVSDIELSLSGVMSSRRISKTPTAEEISEHKAIENTIRSSKTIDGSYHYLKTIYDQAYTYWYNQLTGADNICTPTISAPHSGDGNNRYASGYQWFPNEVDVNFYTDVAANENRTKLWYKYDQSTLNNLNVDSNEALELEVVFYNYNKSSTSQSARGNAFQLIKSGSTWATNQPNSYRDTNFLDNSQEVSFCVGVDDTSDLVTGKWYYWYIDGTKGSTANNYPNDGRFKVTAQRGYRLLGSGAWSVFADEHEAIRTLGISSSLNWVPANKNAWTYAAANDDWNFDSSTDPVK